MSNLAPILGIICIFIYMKKLTETEKREICSLYPQFNIMEISCKYNISATRLKRILSENGITLQNPKRGNTINCFENTIKKYYPQIEGKHYIAISKIDGSEFIDYLNQSGALTKYLKDNGVKVPSSYKRLKFLEQNKCLWHSQYFDITLIDDKKVKKCPYCTWETSDIHNRSGMFLTHILKEHNINREEHLSIHPEDKDYLSLVNKTLDRQMESDNAKYVCCAICGKKLARIDWRHLSLHHMTKEEYMAKYGYTTLSDDLRNRLSLSMIETNKHMVSSFESKAERNIKDMIQAYGYECHKEKKLFDGIEMDIYIPNKKLCIEYNGLRYHTEWFGKKDKNFHLTKLIKCKEKGVRLIHIFEDEYETKRKIVDNKILHLLGVQNNLPHIMGRKCKIELIEKDISDEFLNKYHIQGTVNSTIRLGCFYNDLLIAVMLFKKEQDNKWELTRFASDYNYICCGVGGKLFKYFVKNYNPIEVKSFADRRWTIDEENNIYLQLGFVFDKYTKPDYHYVNSKINRYKRFHKFGFRKQILHKKYGLPLSMTESEMVKALGYDRIWDCGLIRYIWKRENKNEII